MKNNIPVGVATLRERDSINWDPDRLPWICNVFVSDAERGRGIAGKMCRALEIVAADLGFERVHLATAMSGETLYDRIGYVEYKAVTNTGHRFRLMRHDV
jgi:GNAT superfamily N-acetyltransferase